MRTNLLSLTLAALLIPGASALSQTTPVPPQAPDTTQVAPPPVVAAHKARPKKETQKLVQDLTLTPEQEAKVAPLVAARDQQISAAEADTSVTPPEQKKKVRMIRKDFVTKLEAILTDTQKQTFETARAGHAEARKGGVAEPSAPPVNPAPPQL